MPYLTFPPPNLKAFTPVHGKKPYLNNWQNMPKTMDDALSYKSCGVGIVHEHANTCAIDIDNVSIFLKIIGKTLDQLFDGQYQIVSPKENSAKILCTLTPEQQDFLHSTKLLNSDAGVVVEFRMTGQDVMPDSVYPKGGTYTHKGAQTPQPLPNDLYDFWASDIKEKPEQLPPLSKLDDKNVNGKWLPISNYIRTHKSIEDEMRKYGYEQKGKRWLSPNQKSGVPAVIVVPSETRGQVIFSYSASDASIHGTKLTPRYGEINKAIDVAELYTQYEHDGNHESALEAMYKMEFHNPETGEIIKSVEEANRQLRAEEDIADTIEEIAQVNEPPKMSEDILSLFPEPFQILMHNFSEMIYDPIPALYIPAFLALHEPLLIGRFHTVRDRMPNMKYAAGSLSGGGKDDNTLEASTRYVKEFINVVGRSTKAGDRLLNQLLFPLSGSFTSATTMLYTMTDTASEIIDNRVAGGVFMETEATAFYEMLSGTHNPNQSIEIMRVENEAYNGICIGARKVTSNRKRHMEAIASPNFSFFRATQLEPFKKAYTLNMLTMGYSGRDFISYDLTEEPEFIPSGVRNNKTPKVNEEGFKFLQFMMEQLLNLKLNPVIRVVCNGIDSPIYKWEVDVLSKIKKKMPTELYPGIRRIPQWAEKWVTTITGYVYFWRLYKGESVDDLILKKDDEGNVIELDGSQFEHCVKPLMDYSAYAKYYQITHNIVTDVVSESDTALQEIWNKCATIIKDKKPNAKYGPWLVAGLLPTAMFDDKALKSKAVKALNEQNPERIKHSIARWINENGYVRSYRIAGKGKSMTKTCYVARGGKFDPSVR